MAEVKQRVMALGREAKELRDSERPGRADLAAQESELRATEQRLDAAVKDHDTRVQSCLAHHTKLADLASRLAQGASAQRQQVRGMLVEPSWKLPRSCLG